MRTSLRFPTLLAALALVAGVRTQAQELPNLALKAKVTASSVQDGNPLEAATDGDEATRWCAEDGSAPQTLEVDLGGPHDVGGCQILWEQGDKLYQYTVEGSTDGATWTELNDLSQNAERAQKQTMFLDGKGIRKIRLNVTRLDDGAWASVFEFRVFAREDVDKLPTDKTADWWPAMQVNVGKHARTTASSAEDDHPTADAVDAYDDTRWAAKDAALPAWLQLQLKQTSDLTGASILWEKDGVNYQYKLEGSTDGTTWTLLSDQTKTTSAKQLQRLKFEAKGVKFVRLTVTGVPAGTLASVCELQVLGKR